MTLKKLLMLGLLVVSVTMTGTFAQALEPIDFDLAPHPEDTAKSGSGAGENDDSFFSGRFTSNITGGIERVSTARRSIAPTHRPRIDVVATCRVMLADQANQDASGFVGACKRALFQAGLGGR